MLELPAHDLDYIVSRTRPLWKDLRGGRLFITGGTSFTGRWLLDSFVRANDFLNLNAHAVILTRDPGAFRSRLSHLASHPAIHLHTGDIRDFSFPLGRFTHIIHADAERNANLYYDHPMHTLDLILTGTRHVLDFSLQCGTPKFLLISSGAVYGRQPSVMTHIPEEYQGKPDISDPSSVFGEGKRISELLCLTYGQHYGLQIKIGRCFYALGPDLAPDNSFCPAVRFIQEGLRGGPINVNGNGTSHRSYIYVADMAIWLWYILIQGECSLIMNVGSDQPISDAELALHVGKAFLPPIEVHFNPVSHTGLDESYVPSTQRAHSYFNLKQEISLDESIQRTIEWYRHNNNFRDHQYGKTKTIIP